MSLTVDAGGILQYFMWDTQSDAFAAPKTAGIVTGGTLDWDYPTERNEGINDQESPRAGLNEYHVSPKGRLSVDTKLFLAAALRGSGALPLIAYKAGTAQQGGYGQNALINMFQITIAEDNQPMEWDAEIWALNGAGLSAPLTQPLITGTPWGSFNHATLIGGTDYGIKSARFKIMNNLEEGSTGSTKSAGTLRDCTYMLPSKEQHEIELVTLMPVATFGAGVDSPSNTIALVSTIGGGGGSGITLTYSNLSYTSKSFNQEFKVKGAVRFKHKLIGRKGCLVVS